MNTAIMNEKMAHAFTSAILSAHERMHERDINAMLSIFVMCGNAQKNT